MTEKFIQLETLKSFVNFEVYILLLLLSTLSYLFYILFLNQVSEERHKNLKNHHKNALKNLIILAVFTVPFVGLLEAPAEVIVGYEKVIPYVGLAAYFWGIISFVRICRLWVLQYLFLQSLKEGVPLLIVNVVSLILLVILMFWSASKLFNLQLAPLLATSAAFSIILGLAMQDTLGNLFAGISLQLDRCFEIGNWLEIHLSGTHKIIGQVKEISWRSVTLVGLSDEIIVLPNRTVSQSQISNFSPDEQPIIRSHLFRIDHQCDPLTAKDILERSAAEVADVRGLPSPFAYIQEINESWIAVKLIYFIDSYGAQYVIGDKVMKNALASLHRHKIQLAKSQIQVYLDKQDDIQHS